MAVGRRTASDGDIKPLTNRGKLAKRAAFDGRQMCDALVGTEFLETRVRQFWAKAFASCPRPVGSGREPWPLEK